MQNERFQIDGLCNQYILSRNKESKNLIIFLPFNCFFYMDYKGYLYEKNEDGAEKIIYNIGAYENMAEFFWKNGFSIMHIETGAIENPKEDLEHFLQKLTALIQKVSGQLHADKLYFFAAGAGCILALLLSEIVNINAMICMCGAGMSREAEAEYFLSYNWRFFYKIPFVKNMVSNHYKKVYKKYWEKNRKATQDGTSCKAYFELFSITEMELLDKLKKARIPIYSGCVQYDFYYNPVISHKIEMLHNNNIQLHYFPKMDFTLRACDFYKRIKELKIFGYSPDNINYSETASIDLKKELESWISQLE